MLTEGVAPSAGVTPWRRTVIWAFHVSPESSPVGSDASMTVAQPPALAVAEAASARTSAESTMR